MQNMCSPSINGSHDVCLPHCHRQYQQQPRQSPLLLAVETVKIDGNSDHRRPLLIPAPMAAAPSVGRTVASVNHSSHHWRIRSHTPIRCLIDKEYKCDADIDASNSGLACFVRRKPLPLLVGARYVFQHFFQKKLTRAKRIVSIEC